MRRFLYGVLTLGVFPLLLLLAARADDANPLLGVWRETVNQQVLLMEFDAASLSMRQADAGGKPTGPPITVKVKYRRQGDVVSVEYQTATGGNLLIRLDTADRALVIVPGSGGHEMLRVK